jgi:hypothetical protein
MCPQFLRNCGQAKTRSVIPALAYVHALDLKGLSFISHRRRRKEDTFCALQLEGIEPTPPAPEEQSIPTTLSGAYPIYHTSFENILTAGNFVNKLNVK